MGNLAAEPHCNEAATISPRLGKAKFPQMGIDVTKTGAAI
jgi:hypothetical protein